VSLAWPYCHQFAVIQNKDLCRAGSVELRNAVAENFSVELAATVTFDHPTAQALAAHIAARIAPAADAAARPLAAAAGDRRSAQSDVRRIERQLQEAVAPVLGDQPLVEAGLDSIGACCAQPATRWLLHIAWVSFS
jgi:hypothetical protein